MVQVILGNILVCMGPYLPKHGAELHLAVEGDTEWQSLASKTYDSVNRRGIKTVEAGCL